MSSDEPTEVTVSELYKRIVQHSLTDPRSLYRALFGAGLIGLGIPTLFPFYYIFVIAFTPLDSLTDMGFTPRGFNVEIFAIALNSVPVHHYIFNSIVIAFITMAVVLTIGSLAGYAFGRLEFPGKAPLLVLLLVISYFPGTTFIIPLFRIISGSITIFGFAPPRLLNTPGAVVLPLSGLAMPLTIFILTTFYSQVPDGLEDAARIEGCSRIGALYRVIIPLSLPGVVTAGILVFILVYNDFFFSYLLTDGNPEHWAPLVHGIVNFQDVKGSPFNEMAAASIIGLIPIFILVYFGQKRIISGLTAGALKE